MNKPFVPPRLNMLRGELSLMVAYAASLRAEAAAFRTRARKAESADAAALYQWLKAKAKDRSRRARIYIAWGRQKQAEIAALLKEKSHAA